jgi:tetratricopeptide (TPR) repeat protein
MRKLIAELRRREVFRTVGLYIGIAWILIEAASVMLPAFGAPDWTLRAVIICAIIGLPITIVLAWIYDFTESGIEVQDATAVAPDIPFGGRKADFAVIGVLVLALAVSVYMNVTGTRTMIAEAVTPVSLLIADFDNQTGDPLFDDSLEQAFSIGLEGAAFVTAYKRTSAVRLLEQLKPGSELNEEGARLVSIREGIKYVISGAVAGDDDGYDLSARLVSPDDGETVAEFSVAANNKLEVLTAISALTDEVREELGDESVDDEDRPLGETFTASSLEAVKNYTEAQNLAASGRFDEAIRFYEQAIAADGDFGRAYSGWALALFALGRQEQAAALWERALAEMDSMSERERLRTLGLYYVAIAGDYPKAVESYEALVEKYPADNTGHNNKAIAYYYMLDFKSAMESAGEGLKIYPSNNTVRLNYALFAMLAGEFEKAADYAKQVLEIDPGIWKAWLPIAMEKLASGDINGAKEAYANMEKAGSRGAPFANLGLADIALYAGDHAEAIDLLEAGVEGDAVGGNQRLLGRKYLALAEAHLGLGDEAGAREAITQALEVQQGDGQLVPAALLYVELGDKAAAGEIADTLVQQLQPKSRSFGRVIQGAIAIEEQRYADAVDSIREGITLTDSWVSRFYLGRAYYEAGRYIEALDEFEHCMQRKGEATALFLEDDEPTYHNMAALKAWLDKSRVALGMPVKPEPKLH